MKIRVTTGAFRGAKIRNAEPCDHPNHAGRTAHLTITVFGGPWCVWPGEYEVVGADEPKAVS